MERNEKFLLSLLFDKDAMSRFSIIVSKAAPVEATFKIEGIYYHKLNNTLLILTLLNKLGSDDYQHKQSKISLLALNNIYPKKVENLVVNNSDDLKFVQREFQADARFCKVIQFSDVPNLDDSPFRIEFIGPTVNVPPQFGNTEIRIEGLPINSNTEVNKVYLTESKDEFSYIKKTAAISLSSLLLFSLFAYKYTTQIANECPIPYPKLH